MINNNRIQEIIELIHIEDKFFRARWDSFDNLTKEKLMSFWDKCIKYMNDFTSNQILSQNAEVYLKTRGFFSLVQEKPFRYSEIPKQWRSILDYPDKMQELYSSIHNKLLNFTKLNGIYDNVDFYGSIKTLDSIEKKINLISKGSAPRKNLIDIWDLIRFRICTDDLKQLVKIGYQIWCNYFDNIINCRNYYFMPRNGNVDDAYRAIHFQILDSDQCMFELQLLTKSRDAISLLDHSIVFRKIIQVDTTNLILLQQMSYVSNILEGKEFQTIKI